MPGYLGKRDEPSFLCTGAWCIIEMKVLFDLTLNMDSRSGTDQPGADDGALCIVVHAFRRIFFYSGEFDPGSG